MSFLYHRVPAEMKGESLVPLSELRDVDSVLWEKACEKYRGRDSLMDDLVPPLECRWSDVVFLSPVHPERLHSALRDSGCIISPTRYFVLDADSLNPKNIAVMMRGRSSGPERVYEPFDAEKIAELDVVPAQTLEYYRVCAREGVRPLLFRGIPHILHRGPIGVSDASVVEVS